MNDFIQFLAPNQDLSLTYLSTYSVPLVMLSVLMAVFASFMALELSGRIAHAATAIGKIVWLVPGALALGGGVWAMHFIGMLALSLPCGITYDPIQTLASMLPGVAASAAALWTISRTRVSVGVLVIGGILMGGGIGIMHYSGMAAMRLDAVIYYSPAMFALSIGFAVVLAILSLYAKFVLRHQQNFIPGWAKSFAAAIFMGAAISGMHYIAMEAAYFIPAGDSLGIVPGISPTVLAIGISVTTAMLVALALAASILGRHVETINALEREIGEREQAENALHESDERFSLVMRGANDGLWDWNFKTNYVYYSPRWCGMLGYKMEELEPSLDTWASLVAPQDKDRVLEEVNNYVEGRADAFDTEFRMRHKDGSLLTILSRAFLSHDNGEAVRLVGTHVDITEIKKSEQMLQALVEGTSTSTGTDFFHHLTQSLADILEVDYAFIGEVPLDAPDSVRTMSVWAKGAIGENIEYALAGTPCDNVVGREACCYSNHVQQLFPTDHLLVEMGVEAYAGVPLFSSDGTALGLLVALDCKPMQNLEAVKSMLTIFSARAGAELERERAALRAKAASDTLTDAIESLPDAFVLYDKDDRMVICNEKYRTFYPKSAPLMQPGKTFEEIIRYGIEQGEYVQALGSIEQQEIWLAERLEKHRNPQEVIEQNISDGRWLRVKETKTSDGGTVGFRIDITDLKNTETELLEHKNHLEDLVVKRSAEVHEKAEKLETALLREKEYNALQQKFVALVSHEFRTPLSIIDGMAQRLIRRKDDLDASDIETRASKVRSAVERMIGLIDTTLYASRLDAGQIEMKRTSNDIGELLLDVCERQAEIAPEHQFNVEIKDLPKETLIDRGLLDQVFTNLLSNAVKYAPQTPHIEVKGWQENEDVVITVTDHGVGIPEGDLPHMFERFFRASTAEGIKGTGLGLSVCKEFVEMHGGTIEVDSAEGVGAAFTVRLPIGDECQLR